MKAKLLGIIVLVAVVLTGGVFIVNKTIAFNNSKDWNIYRDELNGFEFRYPKNFHIEQTRSYSDNQNSFDENSILLLNGISKFHLEVLGEKKMDYDIEGEWALVDWKFANVFYSYGVAGSRLEKILIKHGDKYFAFSGSEKVDRYILNTFRFLH